MKLRKITTRPLPATLLIRLISIGEILVFRSCPVFLTHIKVGVKKHEAPAPRDGELQDIATTPAAIHRTPRPPWTQPVNFIDIAPGCFWLPVPRAHSSAGTEAPVHWGIRSFAKACLPGTLAGAAFSAYRCYAMVFAQP